MIVNYPSLLIASQLGHSTPLSPLCIHSSSKSTMSNRPVITFLKKRSSSAIAEHSRQFYPVLPGSVTPMRGVPSTVGYPEYALNARSASSSQQHVHMHCCPQSSSAYSLLSPMSTTSLGPTVPQRRFPSFRAKKRCSCFLGRRVSLDTC